MVRHLESKPCHAAILSFHPGKLGADNPENSSANSNVGVTFRIGSRRAENMAVVFPES